MSLIEAPRPVEPVHTWGINGVCYAMGYLGIRDLVPPVTDAELDDITAFLNREPRGIGVAFDERQKDVQDIAKQIDQQADIVVTAQRELINPLNPVAAI